MSSGNLTADRRFAYARMLREDGDPAAAADVIGQALALAPTWPEGHFALAEALAESGQPTDAAREYRTYLVLDPADSMGAAVRLALLDNGTPETLPEAYVRRLFDEYAPRFDTALVERLAYRAPQALRHAIDAVSGGRRYAATLDLGCGTGLSGAAVRDVTAWLEGVDLSARMIAEAQRKNLYDRLAVGDIASHLASAARRFDLILAADVLVYLGRLDTIFGAARRALTDDGLFAFTVQHSADSDYRLGPEHRYSHSRPYITACAAGAGFAVARLDDETFRREKGIDVPGLLAILRPAS